MPQREICAAPQSCSNATHSSEDVNCLSAGGLTAYGSRMERDLDKQRAAIADLARLREERDALGTWFGRAGAPLEVADDGDRVELWGRRIGRTLSVVAFLALAVYLCVTYVR
jgi:hypothetical protein